MNRTYRSIWNESLGAWVAASEIASARGKKSRSARSLDTTTGSWGGFLLKLTVPLALGAPLLLMGVDASANIGGLALCSDGARGTSYGAGNQLTQGGAPVSNTYTFACGSGFNFFLGNGAADVTGSGVWNSSTAYVAAGNDGILKLVGTGVSLTGPLTVSGGSTFGINMSNQKITNLAAGTATGDAVNFGQLSTTNSNLATLSTANVRSVGNFSHFMVGAYRVCHVSDIHAPLGDVFMFFADKFRPPEAT